MRTARRLSQSTCTCLNTGWNARQRQRLSGVKAAENGVERVFGMIMKGPWNQNTAIKVGWHHSAGTSQDVSSDILRTLQRALLSGALQACSTPLLEIWLSNFLDTGFDTHTSSRFAARRHSDYLALDLNT